MVYERMLNARVPMSNNYNLNYSYETNIEPHFYRRLQSVDLHLASQLPNDVFFYELNWDYNKSHQEFFDSVLTPGNIRESILTRLKEKTAFILLTVLYEGWLADNFLQLIHTNFNKVGIPLSQIVYVSNCYNGKQLYEDFCKRQNIIPEIKNEYCPTFRIDQTDVESIINNTNYVLGRRKKTFLCFNRRFSDHRLLFFMLIEKRNLLDYFFLSMSKDQPESSSNFAINATYLIQRFSMFKITSTDIIRADKKLPLILDNPNFNKYPMESNPWAMKQYYDDSLINVISETYFFNNIIHITEKTYKPIGFMQPFIMIASPFSLKHIKDMGFKTFSAFWDESYDTETDHIVRMNKIVQLVEIICNWSDEEKINFSQQVEPILKYNRDHLRTMKHIEMDQFINNYSV
jgi:hypothetical protein